MIATTAREAYLRGMTAAHLIRLLIVLALLLAPMTMVGEHSAMAMPPAPEASAHHPGDSSEGAHCDEMTGQPLKEKTPDSECLIDCAIACSAIPAVAGQMADQPLAIDLAQPLPLVARISGLHPESDLPPPRTA